MYDRQLKRYPTAAELMARRHSTCCHATLLASSTTQTTYLPVPLPCPHSSFPPHVPHPLQVLLLDEITVDLDVLGRAELMRFLVGECSSRGATIIYATHIFDGLEFWPTHVAYVARGEWDMEGWEGGAGVHCQLALLDVVRMLVAAVKGELDAACWGHKLSDALMKCAASHPMPLSCQDSLLACSIPSWLLTDTHTHPCMCLAWLPAGVVPGCAGQLQFCQPASSIPQLAQGQLLELVVDLLRKEREAAAAAGVVKPLEYNPELEGKVAAFSYVFNNGWVPGTLGTTLAHGTNTVMRN